MAIDPTEAVTTGFEMETPTPPYGPTPTETPEPEFGEVPGSVDDSPEPLGREPRPEPDPTSGPTSYNYLEAPSVLTAPLKEENNFKIGQLSDNLLVPDPAPGTLFVRDFLYDMQEPDEYAVVRGLASATPKEAYTQQIEGLVSKGLNTFGDAVQDVWRGAVLRNIQSAEDAVNYIARKGFDSDRRFNFAPEFQEGDGIIEELAEYVPLSMLSWGFGAARVASLASKLGMGKKGALALNAIKSSQAFAFLVAMKNAARPNEKGESSAPLSKYGAAADLLTRYKIIPQYETRQQMEERITAYNKSDILGQVWQHYVPATIDDGLAGIGIYAGAKLAFGTGKLLLKPATTPARGVFRLASRYLNTGVEKNASKVQKLVNRVDPNDTATAEAILKYEAEIRNLKREIFQRQKKARKAPPTPQENSIQRKLEMRLRDLEERKIALSTGQARADRANLETNLKIIHLTEENLLLQSPKYTKTKIGDELHVVYSGKKGIHEQLSLRKSASEAAATAKRPAAQPLKKYSDVEKKFLARPLTQEQIERLPGIFERLQAAMDLAELKRLPEFDTLQMRRLQEKAGEFADVPLEDLRKAWEYAEVMQEKARKGVPKKEGFPDVIDEKAPKAQAAEQRDILPPEELAGVSRRKVLNQVQRALALGDDTVSLESTAQELRRLTDILEPDLSKAIKDPQHYGNLVQSVSSAHHKTIIQIQKLAFPEGKVGLRAYKDPEIEKMIELVRKWSESPTPTRGLPADQARLQALLSKKDALAELQAKLGTEAGANLQAMNQVQVKDRFLNAHRPLHESLRRMQQLRPEEREALLDIMDKMASGVIKAEDLEIYRLSPINSAEQILDMAKKNALNSYLAKTALVKAAGGNVAQTAKKAGKTFGSFGLGATIRDFWRGFWSLGKTVKAKGLSEDHWARIWDDMGGVTASEALTKRHVANVPRNRGSSVNPSGLDPRSAFANPNEQAFNRAVSWRFAALEHADVANQALNMPNVVRDTVYKIAHRVDKKGKLVPWKEMQALEKEFDTMVRSKKFKRKDLEAFRRDRMGHGTHKDAIGKMPEVARRLREGILRPGSDDELVEYFRRLSLEETDRLSYRANLATSEDAQRSLVGQAANRLNSGMVKKTGDGWISMNIKHIMDTTIALFTNTMGNIAHEGSRVISGAAQGLGILARGKLPRNVVLSARERENINEALWSTIGAMVLGSSYYLYNENGTPVVNPLQPGEDLRKRLHAAGVAGRPKSLDFGELEVGNDLFGHMGEMMGAFTQVMAMVDTAEQDGNVDLSKQGYNLLSFILSFVTPHDVISNLSEYAEAAEAGPDAEKVLSHLGLKLAQGYSKGFSPLSQDVKNLRQRFEDHPGDFSAIETHQRPPSEVLGARDQFFKGLNVFIDAFVSQYGVKGHYKLNMFGVPIPTYNSAAASDVHSLLSVGMGGNTGADPKYQDLVLFMQRYKMLGTGQASTAEQSGIPLPIFPAPSRTLKVQDTKVINETGVQDPNAPRSAFVPVGQPGSRSIPPHKMNEMRGLVSGSAEYWEDLKNRIEAQGDPELMSKLAELRQQQSALFVNFGSRPGEFMIDVIDRIATAKYENLRGLGFLDDYAAMASQLLGHYGDVYRDLDTATEKENIARAYAMSDFYTQSWQIVRSAMALDPFFADTSPALRGLETIQPRQSKLRPLY